MSNPLPHEYRSKLRDPNRYLQKSLDRLATFVGWNQIRTPTECQQALNQIDPSLFYTNQYKALVKFAKDKER